MSAKMQLMFIFIPSDWWMNEISNARRYDASS